MADPAKPREGTETGTGRRRLQSPSASSKAKVVVRSQKIAAPSSSLSTPATSPTETRHPQQPVRHQSELDETYDRAPPMPRSHTPGHLSVKSQDRRRKPSELAIRQRSQSSAATPTGNPAASQVSFSLPSSGKSTSGAGPSSAPVSRNMNNGVESGGGSCRARTGLVSG